MQFIENKTFDQIKLGDVAAATRTLPAPDAATVVGVSEGAASQSSGATEVGAPAALPGAWAATLIAELLATELPGPGTVYLGQSLRFLRPGVAGDAITTRVRVREKFSDTHRVTLDCECLSGSGDVLVTGQADVIAPTVTVRHPRVLPPDAQLHPAGSRYQRLLDAARAFGPIGMAVVHPCDVASLGGAIEARDTGLIVPVLVGPVAKIQKAAVDAGLDLKGAEIIDAPHSHAAAERAVALARERRVDAVMKGALHTDELMAAAVDKVTGLRTDRRMSHVFVLDVPHYPKPLFITDAAINIAPDLDTKRDITQNAIWLAHALGIPAPRVAILSAVETVTSKIPSTVDAAALCKMADRGQIVGGILDGPLAFDNAISSEAARSKGISSPVAGQADILVVPDLEAGNMLAKQLIYLAGADAAGIVLGARVPIVLTSRADGRVARLASCALAQLLVHHRKA